MLSRCSISLFVAIVVVSTCDRVRATEPNEAFGQATQLAPGVLSVNDSLTSANVEFPDTLLGIRDLFGEVYFVDDNGSPAGDGLASGVGGVPTNSGTIDFSVSGFPDDGFFGDHGQSGDYEVFVVVYDFGDEEVASFSEIATLQPGNVDDYTYSNFEWIGGSYDVYIDNTVGGISDVDFFTFTGLVPGADFSAETMELGFDIDTLLGWFDNAGGIVATNDDIAPGNLLSRIEGTVPANGKLTFAVTGYGDDGFQGAHLEDAPYSLQLTIEGAQVPGDYDGDSDVDGRDFLIWQRGGSPNPRSSTDLAAWQTNYGAGGLLAVATAVPEPAAYGLLAIVAFALSLRRSAMTPMA